MMIRVVRDGSAIVPVENDRNDVAVAGESMCVSYVVNTMRRETVRKYDQRIAFVGINARRVDLQFVQAFQEDSYASRV